LLPEKGHFCKLGGAWPSGSYAPECQSFFLFSDHLDARYFINIAEQRNWVNCGQIFRKSEPVTSFGRHYKSISYRFPVEE
jgi:hypothetical protein